MKALLILASVIMLSATGYAVTDTIAFLNETGITTVAHAWDNITIRITNSAANAQATVAEAGTVKLNSTSDSSGIIITVIETGVNTGIFEGYFHPQEGSSDEAKDYLKCADGGTIYVYSDIDNDTLQGEASLSFDVDPDKIKTFTDAAYTNNVTHFSIGDLVYMQIASRASVTPNTVAVTGNGSLSLTPVETTIGLYRISFRIMNKTNSTANELGVFGGSSVTVSSDLDGGGQYGTHTIYVRDAAYTYENNNYNAEERFFKWGSTVYLKVDNSLHNADSGSIETGYVRVNSSAYPAGIMVALTETGANTGSFRGSFTINDTTTSGSQIKANSDDMIKISADLDSNELYNATINVTVDNTKPVLASYEPGTKYLAPSTAREIKINITDTKQTNLTIKVHYWRSFAAEDLDQNGVLNNNEGTYTIVTGTRNTSASYAAYINDFNVASNGNVSYWITAEDAAGNALNGGNWSEPLHTYTIDSTAPTITMDEPGVNQQIVKNLKINATWNDTISGVNFSSGHFTIKKNSLIERTGSLVDCAKDYCRNTIDVSNLSYGYLTLLTSVKDNAGNQYSKEVIFYNHPEKVEIVKNTSLKIVYVPAELAIKQESRGAAVVSVLNNGENDLNNLSISISGFEYSINRTPKNLTTLARDSFVIDFIVENKSVGTHRIDVKVTDDVRNVYDTSSFILKITPGSSLRQQIKIKYSQQVSEVERIASDINYMESKTDIASIKSLLHTTEEKLNQSMASMQEDYFLAYNLQDEIEKNIEALKKGIEASKTEIGIDFGPILIILAVAAVIGIMAYLFWPVRGMKK